MEGAAGVAEGGGVMKAKQTYLLDLLRAVPADAQMIYDHSPTSSINIPVGVLCDQAATHIAWLEDRLAAVTADRDALTEVLANTTGPERPPFTCWWEWAIKYKRDAKKAEKLALQTVIDSVLSIPNMTDDELAQLKLNCYAAIDAAVDAAKDKK